MASKKIMNIAKDFSPYPGPRYETMGENSGQEFREKYFIPWLKKTENENSLEVNLDGAVSYPPSFLEETFGGAVRAGYAKQLEKIEFICNDEPELIQEIKDYIEQAVADEAKKK